MRYQDIKSWFDGIIKQFQQLWFLTLGHDHQKTVLQPVRVHTRQHAASRKGHYRRR